MNRRTARGTGWLAPFILAIAMPVHAASYASQEFADLSLEELANVRVTSVSRKAESLADAPASIFVITGEDVRRAGSTTLPEALRLAPNLQVSRIDARNYAITARGFNGAFANKLLVLIDGRTVYSPLFSGVFWDAQDVVMEDIDRIEVISGPGATQWGANAVNGVINVITRSADSTQGALAAVGASARESSAVARFGGKLDNGGHYRVYAKHLDNDDLKRADGTTVSTGWRRSQAGFRADWKEGGHAYTAQGDTYSGRLHQLGTRDIAISGANLNGRMNRKLSDGSDISLQTYWDYTRRDQPAAFTEELHTIDVDFQHALKPGAVHHVLWGGGYRQARDALRNGSAFAFLPASLNMRWANLFAQDEIVLRKDFRITAGVKLENTNYTGTEVLPTLRFAWNPAAGNLVWGSASRAVRAPSRIDRDFFSPAQPAIVNGVPRYAIAGGPEFVPEVATVYEAGYRAQPTARLTYSATAFYGFYDKLRTLERVAATGSSVFANRGEGRTRGIEAWGSWQAAPAWRLSAGMTAQRISTTLKAGSTDLSGATGLASNDPSQHWMLRSSFDIDQHKELDITLRRVGKLRLPEVPAYTSLDMRFGWRLTRELELSLIGQNLLDRSHPEFGAAANRSEFERSLFVRLLWRI